MYLIDHLHQRGIGVILDWVPAHFPRDEHGLATSTAPTSTSTPTRARASTPTGARSSSTTAGTRSRNFLISNALFWLDKYHIDGLRVDAVASMLYLDYSRKEGEWIPNQHGGRENLEAMALPAPAQRDGLRRVPRRHHRRRGVDGLADGVAADLRRRARASAQVGHGLDARHARSTWPQDPVHRKYHHNQLTFRVLYAFTENYVLPLSHDEVVHGKGSLISQDAGRRLAEVRQPAAAVRLPVDAAGQEAAVHGRRVRPVARVEPRRAASTGTCSTARCTRASSAGCATSTPSTAASRPCTSSTASRRASSGSTPTTPSRAC